ncbi:MAG: hypothetical protein ACXWKN_14850 [Phenylobacterium sp.]
MSEPTKVNFGRSGRRFDPRIPHWSAVRFREGAPAAVVPAQLDNSDGATGLGFMLNDVINDCTCANFYHARQIWSLTAEGRMITEPDADVQQLYTEITGYDPNGALDSDGRNTTDTGADQGAVLNYLLNTGAPIGEGGQKREKIVAYVQVDPRNQADLRQVIYESGVAFLGFQLPQSWEAGYPYNLPVWDSDVGDPGDPTKGHAVILVGWNDQGFIAISWGNRYCVKPGFVEQYADDAFAVVDATWKKGSGMTPLGMSEDELTSLMGGLRSPSGSAGLDGRAASPLAGIDGSSVVIHHAGSVTINMG